MSDQCAPCGHPFTSHVLLAITGLPNDGGYSICIEYDCECFSVWLVPGQPIPPLLSAEQIGDHRRELRRNR